MSMLLRRSGAVAGALALVGCAPIVANWYYVDGGTDESQHGVRVVVLNRGSHTCTVTAIGLNEESGATRDRDREVLRWKAPNGPVELRPGEIVVVRITEFEPHVLAGLARPDKRADPACVMPLQISVEAEPSCGLVGLSGRFRFDMARRLPNALPDGWTHCSHPRPPAPPASAASAS